MTTPDHTTPLKRCNKCQRELPATSEYWHKDKGKRDGLSARCKECARAVAKRWGRDNSERNQARSREWAKENRERVLQNKRDYYQSHKEQYHVYGNAHKDTRRARKQTSEYKAWARNYRNRRSTEIRAYNRKYRADHPEIYRNAIKEYRKRNPEKAKAMMHQRIAARKGAPGSYTADELAKIYEMQEGRCAYCGITLHDDYWVDHVIPLARGGSNGSENILCACQACNMSKGKKTVIEWMAVRGW